MGWKKELDYLRSRCDAREALVLPPLVLEWFDLNRSDDPEAVARTAAVLERIKEDATDLVAAGFTMSDWRLHTDAYGWRLLLQPYRREVGGPRYYLCCVQRPSKPTEPDEDRLGRLLEYLGVDEEEHFLMHTRGEDDEDVQDFWTWPQAVN